MTSLLDKVDPKMGSQINELAAICKPVVNRIQTLNGDLTHAYEIAIETVAEAAGSTGKLAIGPGEGRLVYIAIGLAMQRAGANKAAIEKALRNIGAL